METRSSCSDEKANLPLCGKPLPKPPPAPFHRALENALSTGQARFPQVRFSAFADVRTVENQEENRFQNRFRNHLIGCEFPSLTHSKV